MEESLQMENPKNPMLLNPVIRCIFQFLNIEDIKNCRLVSHEWSSTGKLALIDRALISFTKYRPRRLPVDFYSCFQDSATLFSAFDFSIEFTKQVGRRYSWTTEELTTFFNEQQKGIKELTLDLKSSQENIAKTIDISSWISKSPMVKNNTEYLTKLSIRGHLGTLLDILPLHLIAHIKNLSLSRCRINLEAGILICPIKLHLASSTLYQNGNKLDRVRINDIVDLSKAKEVELHCRDSLTKYVLDLWGNVVLDNLTLEAVEIVNGETSQWVIKHLSTNFISYSLHSDMKIEGLSLSNAGTIDLLTLPKSVEKLALQDIGTTVSQPIVFEKLQYLHISEMFVPNELDTDYPFLSNFMNCPQLTHLKLNGFGETKMKSIWMPKSVKTLTLERTSINWMDDSCVNLETLLLCGRFSIDRVKKLCRAKFQVQELVLQNRWNHDMFVDTELVDILENRKPFSFGKRFYIGQLKWDKKMLEDSVLKDHVDVKSSFYVFENGEKGRALSEKAFREFIPEHVDIVRLEDP